MGSRANIEPPAKSGPLGFQHFYGSSVIPVIDLDSQTVTGIVDLTTPSPTHDTVMFDSGFTESQHPHGSSTPEWMKGPLEGSAEDNQHEQMIDGEELQQEDAGAQVQQAAAAASVQEPQVATFLGQGSAATSVQEQQAAAASVPQQKTKKSSRGPTAQQKQIMKQVTPAAAGPEKDSRKSTASATKPCLASIFQDSKLKDVEFRSKYIERKENWELAELSDKREARVDEFKRRRLELEFEAEQKRIDRDEQFKEKRKERADQSKETRKDRSERARQASQRNRLDLIIAGWARNKFTEDITDMLTKMDT